MDLFEETIIGGIQSRNQLSITKDEMISAYKEMTEEDIEYIKAAQSNGEQINVTAA